MLTPVIVTLSTKVLATKGNNETVSCTFIAKFANGSEKWLNRTVTQAIGLRKEADNSETLLHKETCALYWKDWSANPSIGTWSEHYPAGLIPLEIARLLPVNSLLR